MYFVLDIHKEKILLFQWYGEATANTEKFDLIPKAAKVRRFQDATFFLQALHNAISFIRIGGNEHLCIEIKGYGIMRCIARLPAAVESFLFIFYITYIRTRALRVLLLYKRLPSCYFCKDVSFYTFGFKRVVLYSLPLAPLFICHNRLSAYCFHKSGLYIYVMIIYKWRFIVICTRKISDNRLRIKYINNCLQIGIA